MVYTPYVMYIFHFAKLFNLASKNRRCQIIQPITAGMKLHMQRYERTNNKIKYAIRYYSQCEVTLPIRCASAGRLSSLSASRG